MRIRFPRCCFLIFMTLGAVAPATPQVADPEYGIVVMAHGGSAEWNREVHDLVEATAAPVPIEIAFGMADRASLAAAISALENNGARHIAVVRLFVSARSFAPQTEYLLGLTAAIPPFLIDTARGHGMRPVPDPAAVPPIAHHSDIAISAHGLADEEFTGAILRDRALALSHDPANETVLIIAHGMHDDTSNQELLDSLRQRAAAVQRAAPFRGVQVVALREDWQAKRKIAERQIRKIVGRGNETGQVIVIPFRVAGFGPYAEVLEGYDYVANGIGLLPHPALGGWIAEQGHEIACRQGWTASDC